MDWTLELVCVPVTDVDRAVEFYSRKVGFALDFDSTMGDTRVVQLTPPGSGCSICMGVGVTTMEPGSLDGVQLVVNDLRTARAELAERGVGISEIQVYDADGSLRPHRGEGDELNNVGFAYFSDPDGNRWAVQQISSRG